MCVQRKVCVPRQREVIHCECVERFCSFELVWRHTGRGNLREAVGYEENEYNEQFICWALDFKVAEKRISAEEIECSSMMSKALGSATQSYFGEAGVLLLVHNMTNLLALDPIIST